MQREATGMMKRIGAAVAALLLALGLTACSGGEPLETGGSSSALPKRADPQSAIEAIYKENTVLKVAPADDALMEKLGFDLSDIYSYNVMYSEGSFGLADTYIIRPYADRMDAVRELLHDVKFNRTKEFERYDILDAYNIAQNGMIYQQGDFAILLMLEDNEAAADLINEFIPVEATLTTPNRPEPQESEPDAGDEDDADEEDSDEDGEDDDEDEDNTDA